MTQPKKNNCETILVVENDLLVLKAVRSILEDAGFCVLAARIGEQAIKIAGGHESIHLLLSGVMMSDMPGTHLAHFLRKRRPEMRVILMASYSGGDMLFLNHGWQFIEKSFLSVQLVEKVNEVLHSPDRSEGDDLYLKPKVAA